MAKENGWTFGWKRKIGAEVSKSASTVFEKETKDDDEAVKNGDVDWLTLVPVKKRHVISLEDGPCKASRLTQEGIMLADVERYWEALKKWDEALLYTPGEVKLHELKAQALLELSEVYPAVEAAQKATQCNPTWWVAHQTQGRALLGLGEVRQAFQSFSRAVHLNPGNEELRQDDLMWTHGLLLKRQALDEEKRKEKEKKKASVKSSVKIQVIDSENEEEEEEVEEEDEVDEQTDKTVDVYRPEVNLNNDCATNYRTQFKQRKQKVDKLPINFVQMRDPV